MLYLPGKGLDVSGELEENPLAVPKRARLGFDKGTSLLVAAVAGVSQAHSSVDTRPACTFFIQGRCAYGAKCNFRHSNTSKEPMPACKFFAQGICTKGASCSFSHQAVSHQAGSDFGGTQPPCKYYAQGGCLRGDACVYQHIGVPQGGKRGEAFNKCKESRSLQIFGDEIGEAPASKSASQSGSDILKKYSSSRRAEDAGVVVQLRARAREARHQQTINSEMENETMLSCNERQPSSLADLDPQQDVVENDIAESTIHVIPLIHLSSSGADQASDSKRKKDCLEMANMKIVDESKPRSAALLSSSALGLDCTLSQCDGSGDDSVDQKVLSDPYM